MPKTPSSKYKIPTNPPEKKSNDPSRDSKTLITANKFKLFDSVNPDKLKPTAVTFAGTVIDDIFVFENSK